MLSYKTAPINISNAQKIILDSVHSAGTKRCSILESLGRILQEDIIAPFDIPPHTNSAMDGYALRSQDIISASKENPVQLRVVNSLAAGYVSSIEVKPGEAIRIMTGAPIPEGADSVIMVERTENSGNLVKIFSPTKVDENIRQRGEDVQARNLILSKGTQLQAAEIGILASIQRAFVTVTRKPRVAIISTGDELVEIDEPIVPGKIVNSNAYTLASLVRECGAIPILLPLIKDDRAIMEQTISEAISCADIFLSSGGVSVGDYDFVPSVLEKIGLEIKFWRVRVKPGKPILYGLLQGKPYFGLPGNPVSSMVTFLLFVKPALRKILGYDESSWLPFQVTAKLKSEIKNKGDRPTYLRAKVFYKDKEFYADIRPSQGSGILSSMLGAQGLVFLPEGTTYLTADSPVSTILIRDSCNI